MTAWREAHRLSADAARLTTTAALVPPHQTSLAASALPPLRLVRSRVTCHASRDVLQRDRAHPNCHELSTCRSAEGTCQELALCLLNVEAAARLAERIHHGVSQGSIGSWAGNKGGQLFLLYRGSVDQH